MNRIFRFTKARAGALALLASLAMPIALAQSTPATTSTSTPATPLNPPAPQGLALLDELRRGGWTLFLAMPELKPGEEGSQAPEWWRDCFATRDLSRQGIDTAVRLGSALRQLRIPFQQLRSSEFCRSLNTIGALGITLRPVKTFAALNTLAAQRSAGRSPAEAAEALKKLLDKPPPPGENFLLIADIPDPAISPDPALAALAPGEIATFRMDPEKGASFVTRLTPDQWWALLAESQKARAVPDAPGKVVK